MKNIKKYVSKKIRWLAGKQAYKWVVKDWTKITDLDLCARVLTTERFRNNLDTMIIAPPNGKQKIVVIAPHQDDETIGAGGTLLKAAKNGAKITCIYITDGSQASSNVDKKKMALMREEEAELVWKSIGGKPIFLRFPDGGIPLSKNSATLLASTINNVNPSVIFIPFLLDDHPEHRRTVNLFWLAKDMLINKNIEIWAYQVWSGLIPNIAVEITDIIAEKNKLNRIWKSQNKLRNFEYFAQAQSAYNSKYIDTDKSPCYYEIFFQVPLSDYFNLCEIYFNNNPEKLYSDHTKWISMQNKNK